MTEQNPDVGADYDRLEAALNDVGQHEGFEGVLTEWVVLAAVQSYDEDGDGVTQIAMLLPDRGGHTPHHRIMGLLDFQLTRLRAEISQDER